MRADGPNEVLIQIETAVSLAESGREHEAMETLSDIIDSDATGDHLLNSALLHRGHLLYINGHLEKAIEDFMQVIHSTGASASMQGAAYKALADCYEEKKEPAAVVDAFEAAVQLGSLRVHEAAATMHNFGVRCNLRGEPDKGFIYFTAVTRKESETAPGIFCNALINRGCYLGDQKHYGLAEDDFRRVLAYPNLPQEYFGRAQYNLGHMYWVLSEYEEAIEAFSRAIDCRATPRCFRLLAQCKRAHSHQRAGRHEMALNLLSELMPVPEVESQDDYEILLFFAGVTFLGVRRHKEAEELFGRTASIPGCSPIMKARSIWSLGYSQCVRTNSSIGVPLMQEARASFVELHEPEFVELIDRDLERYADPGS